MHMQPEHRDSEGKCGNSGSCTAHNGEPCPQTHIPGTAAVTADLILQSQIQSNSAMCTNFLQIIAALSLWDNIWSY